MLRFFICFILFLSNFAYAREYIRVVGSSTLYPFVTIMAEKFGKNHLKTPIVEATGTGAGFHLFCLGNDLRFPDMVNASRPMKESELRFCHSNKVTNINNLVLGFDGIVLAQNINAKKISLSKKELYLALAKNIYHNEKLIKNPFNNWSDINPSLPKFKIEIYGPSFNSGTRDSLIELVMSEFCHEQLCKEIREDGKYIEMPENDNLIVHKLAFNKQAFGVISFNILSENSTIRAVSIDNIIPSNKNIVNNLYPLARPLYVYYNLDHLKQLPQMADFIKDLEEEKQLGKDSYLYYKGLLNKYE